MQALRSAWFTAGNDWIEPGATRPATGIGGASGAQPRMRRAAEQTKNAGATQNLMSPQPAAHRLARWQRAALHALITVRANRGNQVAPAQRTANPLYQRFRFQRTYPETRDVLR